MAFSCLQDISDNAILVKHGSFKWFVSNLDRSMISTIIIKSLLFYNPVHWKPWTEASTDKDDRTITPTLQRERRKCNTQWNKRAVTYQPTLPASHSVGGAYRKPNKLSHHNTKPLQTKQIPSSCSIVTGTSYHMPPPPASNTTRNASGNNGKDINRYKSVRYRIPLTDFLYSPEVCWH